MTEDRNVQSGDFTELEELLAIHGADRTRWPAPERRKFASLLATDGEAQRLLREAAALDRLLDLAPGPHTENAALAERIVAAASREAGVGSRLRFRRADRRPRLFGAAADLALRRASLRASQVPAAALLAASLVIGIIAGTSGALDAAIGPLAAATAVESEGDADASQLALGSDEAGLLEEDLL